MNRVEIEYGRRMQFAMYAGTDREMNLEVSFRRKRRSDRSDLTRVFVFEHEDVPEYELEAVARSNGYDSIYVPDGKCPAVDKAWKQYNRRVVSNMKKVAVAAFSQNNLGENPNLVFSRKAGCPCGCSSGFIAKDFNGFDIHINKAA